MKKIPRAAKIGQGSRPRSIWLSEELFEFNYFQIGQALQFFISLVIHFPFKWLREEAKIKKTAAKQNYIHCNKKPRVFADEPPSANETFFWRVVTETLH